MTIAEYFSLIDNQGFKQTWEQLLSSKEEIEKWSDLYEQGLAYINKIEKKEMGKYYTPVDVAQVMGRFFLPLDGQALCDIGCGTGCLILEVLNLLSKEEARQYIRQHELFLYDIDSLAARICQEQILFFYGEDLKDYIHLSIGDFLQDTIILPPNCKVISNPPYGKMSLTRTVIQQKTKDLYAAFMEKIINQSKSAVIITPHSFLNGDKFDSLRQLLGTKHCDFYAFDNVPGNIFNGPKRGIFNSNNVNSVRACISIITDDNAGIYTSEFIRFSNAERSSLLQVEVLKETLSTTKQEYKTKTPFFMLKKGAPTHWLQSPKTIENLLTAYSDYAINVPTTCRYYTVGAVTNLSRQGKYVLYAKSKEDFYLLYGLLNSSYCYYFYRLANGGITYPIRLLKKCPVPNILNLPSDFKEYCDILINNESDFIVTKKNAGEIQENIKIPAEYRNKLNQYMSVFFNEENYDFTCIHQNHFF